MSKLTIGSLFSGIGGFEYVAQMYGIEPVWASEIEEPCIRITKRHFPNMKHYGDITKMNGAEIEPVDIISGGSPCQSLSLAGKQDGIKHKCPVCGALFPIDFQEEECPKCGAEIELTRSGLFMEQIRIIKEMRQATNERFPKVIIWENVSAAISSNNGDDFQCVLSEFAGLFGEKLPTLRPEKWCKAGEIVGDKGSLAWRTLDAQYWGVPQRRKRIYLVVDLTGQRAGEILFKSESLRGHTPQGEIPWQRTSGAVKSNIGTADRTGKAESQEVESCVVLNDQGGSVMDVTEDKTGTLRAETHGHAPVVVDDIDKAVYGICSLGSNCMKSDNPDSGCYKTEVSKTLDTSGANPSCNQGGNVVVETPVYCIQGNCIDRADTAGCNGKGWKEDVAYTLTTIDRPAVAYSVHENQVSDVTITEELASTITTGGGKPGQGYPCVLEEKESQCGAFLGKQSDSARGIGYSEKVSPTLVAGEPPQVAEYDKHCMAFPYQVGPGVPHLPCSDELSPTLLSSQQMAVMIENHPNDSRVTISGDVCQTLSARMGTGGGNVPLVMETNPDCIYAVTDCSHTQVCVNQSPTLAARDYKSPHIIDVPKSANSIVRRLTPLECERLQGYPEVLYMSSQITRDEIIALCLASRYLLVDFDKGEVYATRGPGGIQLSVPKPLKGSNCNGYKVISLHFGGVKKQCKLHRIVWIAAHGMIPQGMVVDHINCNKQDNRLSNLQLLTPAENSHKASLDGSYLTGEDNPASKINYAIATQIRADYQTGQYVMRELADKYGISKSRVQQIVRFQGWTEEESDAARYKALGNSVALPCVDYVMSGVVDVLDPIE